MIAIPWLVLTTTGSAAADRPGRVRGAAAAGHGQALAGPLIDRSARAGSRSPATSEHARGRADPPAAPRRRTGFPAAAGPGRGCRWIRGAGDGAKGAFVPALSCARGGPPGARDRTGLGDRADRELRGAAMAGAWSRSSVAANALVVDAVSFGVCAAVFGCDAGHAGRAGRRAAGPDDVRRGACARAEPSCAATRY